MGLRQCWQQVVADVTVVLATSRAKAHSRMF
jgi:hypothetical protein